MSSSSQTERIIEVLLVDDDESFLEQEKIFLERENKSMHMKTVKSPKKALNLLDQNNFDCIVSDYQMPEINGLKFLKKAKEEANKDIPFIIFTGKGREEVAMEALNLGADRYLQKGGDPKSQYGVLAKAIKQETERKRTKEEVRKSEKKYRRLVETTGDIIFTHDKDGNIEFINQAGLNFSGYTEEEVKNKNVTDFIPKDQIPALIERSKKRIEEGNREGFNFETAFINKHGERRDVNVEATPLFEDEKFKRELVVARDITERKKTEKKLKESKEKYRALTNEAPIGILTCDEEGEIDYVNDRMLEILGSPGKEKTKEINLLDFPNLKENEFPDALRTCLDTGGTKKIEMKYESKWGKQVWMKTIISPLKKDGSIIGAQIIGEDISDRKEKKEKLEKSEKRYNSLLSNTPAVIYSYEIIDGTPKTTYVSESVVDVLGHKPEYYTSDPENFFNDLHPEDAKELFEKEEKLLEDEDTNRISSEYRFKDKEGNYHWLHDEQQLHTYEDGTQEVIGAWWDITKRKEAEEREKFLHSLLRHDVRNKSQIVQNYLELIMDTDLSEKQEKWLKKAQESSKKETDIIKKVKTLKEINKKEKTEEININSVIKNVINETNPQAQEKEIKIKYEETSSKVLAGDLLKELFSNLIENSIKHSEGSKIKITSQEKENKCIISIEDNGKGIPDKEKQKIFKKGFKTGETAGTGLGTYLAKEIIKAYNGDIEIKDSELGGARFDIHLQKP